MNKDKYVFAQLIEFLNNNKFRRLVDKYDGNHYVKHLTCWTDIMAEALSESQYGVLNLGIERLRGRGRPLTVSLGALRP